MSVTHPAGFRAAGVAAGLKACGGKDVAVIVNDGPSHGRGSGLDEQPLQGEPRALERAGRQGRSRAARSSPTRAARTATRAPRASRSRHATAELAAELIGCGGGRRGRLLDRADRHAQRPRRRCWRASRPAFGGPSTDDGGGAAAEAIMTTDTVAKTAVVEATGWSVGGIAKGAGMLAPGLATMLVFLTTDADVPADDCRRRPARRDPRDLRPARLRRLHVDQRLGRADGVGGERCRARRDDCFAAALTRALPRPGPPAPARRRGLRARHRDHGPRRRDRGRRARGRAGRSRGATCSSARSSARTRTGDGSSPRSARRRPRSTRPTSTSRSTASGSAATAASAQTATSSTCTARDVTVEIDLKSGRARGDGLDQRPDPRVRPRELGVRVMSRDLDRRPRQGGHADRGAAVAGALPRQDRRDQVRRQRDDRRRRSSARSPKTSSSCGMPASGRSSSTAAARRSAAC